MTVQPRFWCPCPLSWFPSAGASCQLHGAVSRVRNHIVLASFPISMAGAFLPLSQWLSLSSPWIRVPHRLSELPHQQTPPRQALLPSTAPPPPRLPLPPSNNKTMGPNSARACWGRRQHGGGGSCAWHRGPRGRCCRPCPLLSLQRATQLQRGAAACTTQRPPGGSETATFFWRSAGDVYLEIYPWHALEGLHKEQGLCVPAGGEDGWGRAPAPGRHFPSGCRERAARCSRDVFAEPLVGGARSAPHDVSLWKWFPCTRPSGRAAPRCCSLRWPGGAGWAALLPGHNFVFSLAQASANKVRCICISCPFFFSSGKKNFVFYFLLFLQWFYF